MHGPAVSWAARAPTGSHGKINKEARGTGIHGHMLRMRGNDERACSGRSVCIAAVRKQGESSYARPGGEAPCPGR
jgi:hypothetical protein